MRVAAIADSHFHIGSRWEECLRIHDHFAGEIERDPPDLILHAGDIYETKSVPEERNAVVAWARRLARVAPLVVVRGNHDHIGDLAVLSRLRTRHRITVVERVEGVTVDGPRGRVLVYALAWPRSSELLAAIGHPIAAPDAAEIATRCLRTVMLDGSAWFERSDPDHSAPHIMLAHASVRGAVTSLGQPLVGADMEIGTEDIALAGADLTVLGHIHAGQSWSSGTIVYPGSPRRTAYGEVEEKAWIMATFEDRNVHVERRPLPAQRMELLDDTWQTADATWAVGPDAACDWSGADVRLRYEVDAAQREVARARAAEYKALLLERGAAVVKVEEVVRTTTRARAPDVARAKSIADKLAAVWAARGAQPDPAQAERLVRIATELETDALASR